VTPLTAYRRSKAERVLGRRLDRHRAYWIGDGKVYVSAYRDVFWPPDQWPPEHEGICGDGTVPIIELQRAEERACENGSAWRKLLAAMAGVGPPATSPNFPM
jgi:hypothetical protein